MSIYSGFFTPQTISILLCLSEATKEPEEVDPHSPVVQYLINKILKITEEHSQNWSNEEFQAEIFSVINDMDFLERYRAALQVVGQSFNSFYRQISNILKTLRSLRNNKLQQGNVVDFLVRRLYIYFQKLDFKEIVLIFQKFQAYLAKEDFKLRRNEFLLTKSIQEVKFNLQNYNLKNNPQQINKILGSLSQNDHTFKSSYLKGLYKAEQRQPNQSLHELHRYFDRCLGNLFQEKTENAPMSNKINHCILSTAYSSLRMGHLQECLQAISEGLRISQNNNDQQSINNCIIYLYKIAEQLGKFQQQILLTEHAITHSLNLSNIVLMVYSCLCYSAFEKKYNCQNSQVTLLKSRHINWTDALHFSKKKIYSNFESNCKNIYHSFRSLLIPLFLHKQSILIHLPQLKSLLLNKYYNRKELLELEVYQEFLGNQQVDRLLAKATRYNNMNQELLLTNVLEQLKKLEQQASSPETIVKIRTFFCKVKLQKGADMETYRALQQLIHNCLKYGFVKQYSIRLYTYIIQLLINNGLYFDALVKIEQTVKFCQQNKQYNCIVICHILKAKTYGYLGNFNEALSILQSIQSEGTEKKIINQETIIFWETKVFLGYRVVALLETNINYLIEVNKIKKNIFEDLGHLLRCLLKEEDLRKIKKVLQMVQDFVLLNPLVVEQKQIISEKLKTILLYINKVEQTYNELQKQSIRVSPNTLYDEEKINKKVMIKIETLYFG